MTQIEHLRYDLVKLEPTPMCEASVQLANQMGATDYYRKRRRQQAEEAGTQPHRCLRRSRWKIDGEHLCELHAGRKALQILTDRLQP